MKIRSILILGFAAIVAGCAAQPSATSDQHVVGPTSMNKVQGGYELSNRIFRVVISDQTGDVIFWGYVDQPRNMVMERGIYTTLTGLPDVPARGHIEKRDDQTWQFVGEDDNHIAWRKIYNLDGDLLHVTYNIQNNRGETLDTAIQINGQTPSLRVQHHDPELFSGTGGYGSLQLQGFNEFPAPASQPVLPVLIQSDTFHIKPKDRQGYTSQWKLLP